MLSRLVLPAVLPSLDLFAACVAVLHVIIRTVLGVVPSNLMVAYAHFDQQ